LVDPRGNPADPFCRLLRELGCQAGLAALRGHLRQLVGDGPQLVRGSMLLGGRLLACLPFRFAEQIARLASLLRDNLPGLVRVGLGDMAAASVAGRVTDARGFMSSDLGGWTAAPLTAALWAKNPRVLSHC
jgi:hypothetical protein